jgi:hypothetical protein
VRHCDGGPTGVRPGVAGTSPARCAPAWSWTR